jgi:hypothetical protein
VAALAQVIAWRCAVACDTAAWIDRARVGACIIAQSPVSVSPSAIEPRMASLRESTAARIPSSARAAIAKHVSAVRASTRWIAS